MICRGSLIGSWRAIAPPAALLTLFISIQVLHPVLKQLLVSRFRGGFRGVLCRRLALEFDKNSLGWFIGEILRQVSACRCPLRVTGLARLFLGLAIGQSHFDAHVGEVNV